MTDFGRHRFSYEPGPADPYSGVLEHAVEMSISGEANIDQMLSFFDAFLKANGYIYEGELQIVRDEPEPFHQMTAKGSQATDFFPFGSSVVDDVFNFDLK
jgi:hypothetical protein